MAWRPSTGIPGPTAHVVCPKQGSHRTPMSKEDIAVLT